ncbi:MAG: hypothetical protein MJA82_13810 [Clostridia bacterium]|nr:hypothetical protein [Clostridia bacterium]
MRKNKKPFGSVLTTMLWINAATGKSITPKKQIDCLDRVTNNVPKE